MITTFNPLGAILIGFLLGIGSMTYFLSRFDREEQSGCFYNSLLLLTALGVIAIALGSLNG